MDLNKFAKRVTLKEGKKKSISIAQTKEVIKIVLLALKKMPSHVLSSLLKRIK